MELPARPAQSVSDLAMAIVLLATPHSILQEAHRLASAVDSTARHAPAELLA